MSEEKLHIVPHEHAISRTKRNKQNGHSSFAIWFVGLSGSGKSTLANMVEQQLYQNGVRTYILDGDNIRSGLNSDLDFSEESRTENIRRIGEVSKLFVDAGFVVMTAFISPFEKDREKVKQIIGVDDIIEVHVDCPIEVCEERDVKGLYVKARAGEISNFTGISSPFEIPQNPTVRLNTAENDLETCVNQLMNVITHQLPLK